MAKAPSNLKIKDKTSIDALVTGMLAAASVEVLVGFTEDTEARKDDEITNAALGFIHDQGEPAANIPQREFMRPGIQAAQSRIQAEFRKIGQAVANGGGADVVEKGLHRVGSIAAASIKAKIADGIPPPLADSTLRSRGRAKQEGAIQERNRRRAMKGKSPLAQALGNIGGMSNTKPLEVTGQLRNAVTYAVRSKKKG